MSGLPTGDKHIEILEADEADKIRRFSGLDPDTLSDEDYQDALREANGGDFNAAVVERASDGKVVPSHTRAAKWFMEHHEFLTPTTEKLKEVLVYRKTKGIWEDGEALIRSRIRKAADFKVTTYFVNEILAAIRDTSLQQKPNGDFIRWENFDRAPGIVVQNGIIDPFKKTQTLAPFDPARLDTVQIPVEYDPDATCPLWENTLREWVSEGYIPVLQEAFGYSLIREIPIHRWFLVYGNGRNGKGTCMNALKALVGAGNASSVSLQSLDESKNSFAKSALLGKLVNICGDIPDKPLRNTGDLKQLTGGDTVSFERKFKAIISRENTTKLWFLGNAVPMTDDDSDAFYARVTPIHFGNQFSEQDPRTDPNLSEKLKKELPGTLNWSLMGLRRLYGKKKFSDVRSFEERRDEWSALSDNVYGFSSSKIEVQEADFVPVGEMWNAYVRYCSQMKTRPVGRRTFNERLEKWIPATYREKLPSSVDTTRPWAWMNVVIEHSIQPLEKDQKDQQDYLSPLLNQLAPELPKKYRISGPNGPNGPNDTHPDQQDQHSATVSWDLEGIGGITEGKCHVCQHEGRGQQVVLATGTPALFCRKCWGNPKHRFLINGEFYRRPSASFLASQGKDQ